MKLATLHSKHGEGVVKWHTELDLTKPDVVMLDVLGDWIAILTVAYTDLHKTTFDFKPEE